MDIDEFNKKLEQMENEFFNEFLTRVAEKTPVRTGALKAGWFWDYADARNPVFSNVEPYAEYVEFGTAKMAPHMMIGTTLLEANDILNTAAKKVGL